MSQNTIRVITWRNAVYESDLSMTTKHILAILASHMNDFGNGCYPSQARIARLGSTSEKTVRTHLQVAEEKGWIASKLRKLKGSEWAAKEYIACFPNGGKEIPPTNEDEGNYVPVGGEGDSGLGGTSFQDGGKEVPTNSPENSKLASFSDDDLEKDESPVIGPGDVLQIFYRARYSVFAVAAPDDYNQADWGKAQQFLSLPNGTREAFEHVFKKEMKAMRQANKEAPPHLGFFQGQIEALLNAFALEQKKAADYMASRRELPVCHGEQLQQFFEETAHKTFLKLIRPNRFISRIAPLDFSLEKDKRGNRVLVVHARNKWIKDKADFEHSSHIRAAFSGLGVQGMRFTTQPYEGS